ncbi:hypothetical protein [Arthrobacter sp. ISL-72]|uniref:hypothetical protein n=1 Tax=Arthrobacter sp. ISL-72 TaxID=2819114 RepID=UPI001BE873F7|nr:hypothetical protein [Arthrobacter sp. ISL-72]MBT2594744.1 hypothetical protein [Arthrobacter sp. ISL-72]
MIPAFSAWSELRAGSFEALGTGLQLPATMVFFLHVAPEMHGLKVPRCGRVAAVDQGDDVIQ